MVHARPLSAGGMPRDAMPVVFLTGATACGKTELAAQLYRQGDYEIISVDAAQVYRGLDIGCAKPAPDFLRETPHHLIDIRAPDETYSAAEFVRDANQLIKDIHARGKTPLLVGGTLFYFHALEHGLSELPPSDLKTRARIAQRMQKLGQDEMHRQLANLDSALAKKIHPADSQRLQRAWEIATLSGRAPSALMRERGRGLTRGLATPPIKLALFHGDRRQLHARIAERFDAMLSAGLLDEVRALQKQYPDLANYACMRAVGYRQALAHLNARIDAAELRAQGAAATRQLAKRQLTWLRGQANVVWFDVRTDAAQAVREFLARRLPAA